MLYFYWKGRSYVSPPEDPHKCVSFRQIDFISGCGENYGKKVVCHLNRSCRFPRQNNCRSTVLHLIQPSINGHQTFNPALNATIKHWDCENFTPRFASDCFKHFLPADQVVGWSVITFTQSSQSWKSAWTCFSSFQIISHLIYESAASAAKIFVGVLGNELHQSYLSTSGHFNDEDKA